VNIDTKDKFGEKGFSRQLKGKKKNSKKGYGGKKKTKKGTKMPIPVEEPGNHKTKNHLTYTPQFPN